MVRSRTSPENLKTVERQIEAYKLRLQGLTFDEIATKLGYRSGASAARKAVMAYVRDHIVGPVDDMRMEHVERLQRIIDRLERLAMRGDLKHIDMMLKAMRRQADLLGLDQGSIRLPGFGDLPDGGEITVQLKWGNSGSRLLDESGEVVEGEAVPS